MDLTEIKITGEYYRQLEARGVLISMEFVFGLMKMLQGLIMVMIVQLCECTKNQ